MRTQDGGRGALAACLIVLLALASSALALPLGNLIQILGVAGCVSEGGSGGNCTEGDGLDGAQGLAATRNGLSVYVASATSGGVAAFLRNPATGALLQLAGTKGCVTDSGSGGECTKGVGLAGSRDAALDKSGKTLYVAASASDSVAVFSRDTSGEIEQLAGTAGCVSQDGTAGACALGRAIDGARAVVVSPDRRHVYVVARDSDSVAAFLRDTTTGAIAQLAGTDGCISENGTNGTCVNGVALDFPTSIAISPKGDHVYVASVGSNAVAIFSRDKTTGVLTQLAGTNGCVSEDGTAGQCAIGRGLLGAFSVAVASDGGHVYVAARDSNAIAAFGRDKQTGILTQLEGTSGCVSEDGTGGECADGKALLAPLSVTIAKNGRNLYVASSVSNALAAFSRDKKTGVLTQLEGTNGCVSEDGTGGECANGQSLVEASGVLVTRNGRSAYVASATSDAVAAFARE